VTTIGKFVISLDFELRWGVRDVYPEGQYDRWLLGGRLAIPRILELFERYDIAATWATVGFLYARDRDELLSHLPDVRPTYLDPRLSPYQEINGVGRDEKEDPLSFAPSLLDQIAATPLQELATHTFSHFYTIEPGQTESQFAADLAAARGISARYGDTTRSLVLPRNQWNPAYSKAALREGVRVYRVNRKHWAYTPTTSEAETPLRRAFRLVDSYVPLSGPTTIPSNLRPAALLSTPSQAVASQFLRPWRPRLHAFEELRIGRIRRDLERAALRGETFHLWWHPHNFGMHTEQNLAVLESILRAFQRLSEEFGMVSASMEALAADGQ
jgi:peptidoglycan/xylan/chitin deacetylase (PgdA/CDA1 family)